MGTSDVRMKLETGVPVGILGLGDSLTHGWEVQRGFFDRFVSGVKERCPSAAVQGHNAGIPGDTAQGGLRRLPALLERKGFDLAVVQFGLNDAFVGVPIPAFAGSLSQICEKLVDKGTLPILVTSCPVERSEDRAIVDRYYAAIEDLACSKDLLLGKLHRYWLDRAADASTRLMGWDGVHPTDAGHELMATALLDELERRSLLPSSESTRSAPGK